MSISTLRRLLHYAVIAFLLINFGCGDIKNDNKSMLPPAQGDVGEIILVMDSAKWKGQLGKALKNAFQASVPGLPQNEPRYRLIYINPLRLNSVLKSAKNMIFVTTLDDNSAGSRNLRKYFTEASLKRIQEDTGVFMFTKEDDFARGQKILHLFGKSDEILMNNISGNQPSLVGYFDQVESERIFRALYKSELKQLRNTLADRHNYSLRIPYGFELAKNEDRFTWLRFLDDDSEKNIFVYYEPFTTKEVFTWGGMLDLREKITDEYLRDSQKRDIYLTYQDPDLAPIITKEINFNGKYAVEMRGLWKLSDISAGGPFLSYVFVDENLRRLYYLEGYVYNPGGNKWPFVREMEVILSTFRTSDQGTTAASD